MVNLYLDLITSNIHKNATLIKMNRKYLIYPFLVFSTLILGCSSPQKDSGINTIYNSKSEAENAAKNFNCSGAHKMGDKWMPCDKHGNH